jgi:adenine C2-methylase RlmN of 23S rRNA A2503 and tRNA A37
MRRITLSTVGVVHGISKLAKECPQIQLALSLHAPNDVIRERIVPTTKSFSIPKILSAVDEYQAAAGRSVMIEYIMISNVNASIECAHELGRLLQGRKCMVNLIPYNPTEAGDRYDFEAPPDKAIEDFSRVLYSYYDDKGKPLRCSVRWSSRRGQDIDAACGQLALKNLRSNTVTNGDIEDLGSAKATRKRSSLSRSGGRNSKSKDANREVEMPGSLSGHMYAFVAGAVILGGAICLLRKRKM